MKKKKFMPLVRTSSAYVVSVPNALHAAFVRLLLRRGHSLDGIWTDTPTMDGAMRIQPHGRVVPFALNDDHLPLEAERLLRGCRAGGTVPWPGVGVFQQARARKGTIRFGCQEVAVADARRIAGAAERRSRARRPLTLTPLEGRLNDNISVTGITSTGALLVQRAGWAGTYAKVPLPALRLILERA